jgi:LPS export ABC transporter protein LptC
MNILKKLPTLSIFAFLLGLIIWALFVPKGDFVEKVKLTLEEQKERADLFFSGVTVAEIVDGKKYWELNARSSELNKTTNITTLKSVKGTFFENEKKALKILSPSAIWYMKGKEIYLSEPIGYDTKFEKSFRGKIKDLRKLKDPRAIFNLPTSDSTSEAGYWFKAHNLDWKLATKRIICTDGIMLTKGKVIIYSNRLEADVAMERVSLHGSPEAMIGNITFEAEIIEINSLDNTLFAEGGIIIKRVNGTITAESALYRQNVNELELTGDVTISYKDLTAWSRSAVYFLDDEVTTLRGDASALRKGNILQGEEVRIDFGNNKVTVKGKTKVKISEGTLTGEAR